MVDPLPDGLPRLPPRPVAVGGTQTTSAEVPEIASNGLEAAPAGPPPSAPSFGPTAAQHVTRHPTFVARALCFAGQLGWFAVPVIIITLLQADRGTYASDGRILTLDDAGTEMVGKLFVVVFVTYQAGWLWWSTVAALNARNVSRRTVWPGAPLTAFLVQFAAVVTAALVHFDDDIAAAAFRLTMLLVVVSAHFLVLGAFRRTAGSLRSPQAPWTRLIALPWAVVAFNMVAMFFLNFVSPSLVVTMLAMQVGLLAWYVMSFYQAMTSFDHGCVGRAILTQDDQAFQKFLKHRS